MRSKNKILYFNITLFVLASLFAINTFSVRGHNLIRNVLAVTDKITGEGTVNYLTRFAGGANPSNQIGDSIIYDDGGGPINGKIGIGTTGPGEKLDVAGSIRANGAIYSMTPGGYGQTVLYQWGLGSTGAIYIEPAAGNHLYLTDSWSGTGTLQSRFAYAQFMNGNSSAYTPIYASDYYSSAAGGIWMSQLCRSNGTNCPAAGNLSGSGTTNYLPIFTGASSLGNSTISDNGSYYTINSRSLYVPSGWVIASDLRSRSGYIYAGGSDWEVIRGNDSWLRLNQGGQFASGVYTPGYLRVDGGVGVVGGNLTVDAGYVYAYNNSYPIRLGELWGHTGLYNGSSSQIMYFASDQYFNFLNRSGNYGPGVYAADFYSNTAGVWMSQLCRVVSGVATNCPVAGSPTWASITGKPTTVAGYGITDMGSQSVSYATTAGSAPANGGTSTYSTYLWSTSHPGSYYISNYWDGAYWQLVSNHGYPVNVGHATNAGNADTVGGLGTGSFRQFNVWQNSHYSGTDGAEYAAAFYYASDERLKTNILSIKGLDIITKLNGVTFDWKKSGEKSAGVIAQDVEKILPEAVSTDKISGLKSVNAGVLIAPTIEAIKELDVKVKIQDNRIIELEKEIQQLKNKK